MALILGQKIPAFTLKNQTGENVSTEQILAKGPALIVFYPGDFTMVCTKQLCNYRDNMDAFKSYGMQVVGVSSNTSADHARFATEYEFPFTLLSDPKKEVAKAFGCTSLLMFGGISRAVFIVDRNGVALYKYVEPTVLSRRKADELLNILKDLRANQLI